VEAGEAAVAAAGAAAVPEDGRTVMGASFHTITPILHQLNFIFNSGFLTKHLIFTFLSL
jgi:hypothetical protein